jgi:hypothetical protein
MLDLCDRAGPDGQMNNDHARTPSKHRATANAARSRATLSGFWPDCGHRPEFGQKPDIVTSGRQDARGFVVASDP